VQELAHAQHGVGQHDELEQQREVLRELHARRVQDLDRDTATTISETDQRRCKRIYFFSIFIILFLCCEPVTKHLRRTMATPAKFARRPDGDAAADGGSTSGFLLAAASHSHGGEASLPDLAAEQFLRRCTSLLRRGFTMKSSAPAFKHLFQSQKEKEKTNSLESSSIACRIVLQFCRAIDGQDCA